MKIILLEDVKGLGRANTVVEAKYGYIYNVLIPRKKAVIATPANMKALKKLIDLKRINDKKLSDEAKEIKKVLEAAEFEFELKFHKGKCKGTITSQMIVEKVNEKLGIEISKKKLSLDHISKPGQYIATLDLFGNNQAAIRLVVKGIE